MPLVSPSRKNNGRSKTPIELRADRVVAAGQSLAATGRRLNQDPTLLGIVRSVRAVLPGDSRVADPTSSEPSNGPRP